MTSGTAWGESSKTVPLLHTLCVPQTDQMGFFSFFPRSVFLETYFIDFMIFSLTAALVFPSPVSRFTLLVLFLAF